MYVRVYPLGLVSANCYVICDEKTGEGAVMDPGDYNEVLENAIKASKMTNLKYILLTHGHFDHVTGVGRLKEKYPDAKVLIGAPDSENLEDSKKSLADFFGAPFYPCKADVLLNDGDIVKVGNLEFKVIDSPGHTKGGILYYCEKENVVFTGDTLFSGSVGRTDGYGGSTEVLLETLKKFKNFPEDCIVCCGHGRSTTIGYELKHNVYLS